ncbi:MAG: hypothetical protein IK038_06570 [Bacteroidaceae bacterium]|nr:hypothetical protein [Bacteroidaceae bacterium]
MKKAYLYCDSRSLNEATLFYVALVEDCLRECDYDVIRVTKLSGINKPDLIFTITSIYYVKAKLKFPFVKTISWRQGLGYQEAKMTRPWWKWLPFALAEYITVKTASALLLVSERMKEYYRNYWGYKKHNYVIMPCYNLRLTDNFDVRKYDTPTFVYAGGMNKWQSVDTILDTYAEVEKRIPNTKLYLYCRDNESLRKELSSRGIINYEINYVTVDQLQQELIKYKYGFILREKNWTNEVATPTKMNSYLAAYLIPIFSDGVDDFKRNIHLGEFQLMTETPLDAKRAAAMIVDFESALHDYASYKTIVENVFNSYYNDNTYKALIKGIILKYIG